MKNIIFLFCLVIIFSSCDRMLLPEEEENNPVSNFDYLWKDFDEYYGGFIVKNINWDSLYSVYRPTLNNKSSNRDLFNAITGLLGNLNDNHVYLFTNDPALGYFKSGIVGRLKIATDFRLSVINEKYLSEKKNFDTTILYGKLQKGDIGYVLFANFAEDRNYYAQAMEKIISDFESTKGIIVDVRNNEGGSDFSSVFVSGYFSNKKDIAFTFSLRNGKKHNDFTNKKQYYIEPQGVKQYLKKVVVLTNRFSISAAETFVLSMSRLENVTLVGDTTSGAFSDVVRRELPNGWGYGISVGDWRDYAGKSYEGKGFPPDIAIKSNYSDFDRGIDKALDKAIELLE